MEHPRDRDDREEILRLRDRVHSIEGDVAALKWLTGDLREWRAEARVQLAEGDTLLDGLVRKEEMETAVTEAVRKERGLQLTALQKLVGIAFAVPVFLDALKTLGVPL